ncbi:hypothetical protein IG631_08337 [Alternaria alternata]|nr:hypothetical protein IG631_08337 [Alternaria alternata]
MLTISAFLAAVSAACLAKLGNVWTLSEVRSRNRAINTNIRPHMRLVEAVTMKSQPTSSTKGTILSDVGNIRVDVHPMDPGIHRSCCRLVVP